jgi:hypothetical protein
MEVNSKIIAETVRNCLTWKAIPGKALYRLLSVQRPELYGRTTGRRGVIV